MPMYEFKQKVDKDIQYGDLQYFFRKEANRQNELKYKKFGRNVTEDPQDMVDAYFQTRTHPYFAILRLDESERDFFLLAVY
jgi:hypothetical protein